MGNPVGESLTSWKYCRGSPTIWRRYGMGCPSTATVVEFLTVSDSDVEDAANQGENDQHVERTAGEEAKASYTYCGLAPDDSAGGSGDITCVYPFRALTEVCTRPLHARTSGPPCERACRLEVLRRVPSRVGGGNMTTPLGGAC